MLDANDIDLAIGVQRGCQSWHRIESLFHWHFVCLYNPQRVGVAGAAITMDEFLQYPHEFTSFSASLRGYVDEQLELMGLQRRVLFSSPGFATSPFIVQRTAALASVPDYIAAIWCRNLGLAVSPLPFPVHEYEVSLLWSVAAEQEPGLRWLRQVVARCAAGALSPAVRPTMVDSGPVTPAG